MKKLYSFIVLLLSLVILFGCARDKAVSTPSESEQKTTSETSRTVKKIRQELLKSDFVLETDNEKDIAILASPDTITYNSVYNELVKSDKQYIIVTAKVVESRSYENPPDSGYSITRVKITKVHETNPKDILKVDDEIFAFECYYNKQDNEGAAVLGFAPPYDRWYYSPLLVEDDEYIFFLADKTVIDQRTLSKADPGGNRLWYNHAAFGLKYDYIEQYQDEISTEALIKAFAKGQISKKSYYYQLHKDVLEKYDN